MYFQQFYLACLSHASYMIGSEGVAAIVDPQRDVAIYLEDAAKHGLEIKHIIETHLHADFVSGHRELAAQTGAQIYIGARAGAKFPHVPVQDGQEISFGRCRLKFLETPGHTVESISILVTDLDRSPEPFAVFTGDTLFIGDVGRPDLSGDKTPKELAAMLYDSLQQKLLKLPEGTEVYPAHGAGSLCGRQMSSERVSTIGKEKLSNYALQAKTQEQFVQLITAELPEKPGYFALDAEINRAGAPSLAELPPLAAMRPEEVLAVQKLGVIVLDTRPADQFAAAHVPNSVHIGLSGQFAFWAAAILGLKQELVLVAEDDQKVEESRMRMARVGMEHVIGYLADGIAGWSREGLVVREVPQISAQNLNTLLSEQPGGIRVLDVRRPAEWKAGHIPNSLLSPLDRLIAQTSELNHAAPLAVHCKSGYRSSIAASLLLRAGFTQVMDLVGGFDAWQICNLPYTQEDSVPAIQN